MVVANLTKYLSGFQISLFANKAGQSMNGAQVTLMVNMVEESASGLQLGDINITKTDMTGVQIGLVNICNSLVVGRFKMTHCQQPQGLQVGLINVVKSRFPNSVFFVPIINVGF